MICRKSDLNNLTIVGRFCSIRFPEQTIVSWGRPGFRRVPLVWIGAFDFCTFLCYPALEVTSGLIGSFVLVGGLHNMFAFLFQGLLFLPSFMSRC